MSFTNDLDFFVIVKDSQRNQCASLIGTEMCFGKWSGILEIDVDFGPARSLSSLAKVRDTMMYQELKAGYRLVYGELDAMQTVPEADYRRIPRAEAMRLLLNRGAGLLFADEKIQSGKTDRKTGISSPEPLESVLGCGDAVLICANQYTAGGKTGGSSRQFSEAEYPGLADFYSRRLSSSATGAKTASVLKIYGTAVSLWMRRFRNPFLIRSPYRNHRRNDRRICLSSCGWKSVAKSSADRMQLVAECLPDLLPSSETPVIGELYQYYLQKTRKGEYYRKKITMSHQLWFRCGIVLLVEVLCNIIISHKILADEGLKPSRFRFAFSFSCRLLWFVLAFVIITLSILGTGELITRFHEQLVRHLQIIPSDAFG